MKKIFDDEYSACYNIVMDMTSTVDVKKKVCTLNKLISFLDDYSKDILISSIGINPVIENLEDENRLFTILFLKSYKDYLNNSLNNNYIDFMTIGDYIEAYMYV